MKKVIIYLVIWLLGISNNYLHAQESKYQALYLFNFTKYLNWEGEKITIGVLGNSPVLLELSALIKQNPNIELSKISGADAVISCDMIYLPSAQSRNFELVQKHISNRSIVIVAEDETLIDQGAEFAFYSEEGRLKFAINKMAVDDSGVKMSARLLSLGKIVN